MDETKNFLGHAIDNEKAKLDAGCKELLGDKQIAAFICQNFVPEFKGMEIDKIIPYLIGDPQIGSYPVDDLPDKVALLNSESKSTNEGTVNFDVLFDVRLPKKAGKVAKIIVNVEAQNAYNKQYSILTRAIYYCGRLLSFQKERNFKNSDYDKLEKVYSIWLCISPPAYASGTINKYDIQETCVLGNNHFKKYEYDKLCVVLVCLKDEKSVNNVVRFFSSVFSGKIEKDNKYKVATDCGLKLTSSLEGGISNVCDYSTYIEQRGIDKGIQQGMQQGEINSLAKSVINLVKNGVVGMDDAIRVLDIPEDIRDAVIKKVAELRAKK